MTLLVDVGNSAIKWAQMSANGELRAPQRQSHQGVDGIAAHLLGHWRNSVACCTHVSACTVSYAQVVAAVEQAAQMAQLQPVRWLRSQRQFEGPIRLTNGY